MSEKIKCIMSEDNETCLTHNCNPHEHCMEKGCPHCDLDKNRYHIKDVKKISLEPGDIVMVKLNIAISQEQLDGMHKMLKHLFPDNKVIVTPDGVDLEVIKPLTNAYLRAKDRGEVE